jgi:hypothetical protein
MEGLKLRSFIMSGLLIATAAVSCVSARPTRTPGHDEAWIRKVAPFKVAGYNFIPSASDPLESYHNPQMVYDTLKATDGMLARVYSGNNQGFDVNLIASSDKASFHDPRVCFSAQGYSIDSEEQVIIKTKHRGDIPATLAQMTGPDGATSAVYFYRGPHGFYGTTMGLKWALLFDQLKGKADLDGVFYRFIPEPNIAADRLVEFVGLYMDEAGKTSGGFF